MTQADVKTDKTVVVNASKYRWQDYLVTDIARFYSEQLGKPFMVAIGKHEDFDIVSSDEDMAIEIKCETTPSRTGNIAIEYWNTDFNKPSGILQTKASIWLHIVFEKGVYIGYECEVKRLLRLCLEKGKVVSNGRNSLCKIISLDEFRKCARIMFQYNADPKDMRPQEGGSHAKK